MKMADQPEAKNIDNIYYDCLERIFEFLDLKSLLNVAHTCKRLQTAAAAKFGDEHGKNEVYLRLTGKPYGNYLLHGSEIHVGQNHFLPFLRCFGSKISNLNINHEVKVDLLAEPVNQYISKYCVDTLISITLIGLQNQYLNEIFQKQFQSVVEVTIIHHRSKIHLPKLLIWLPNIRRLDMFGVPIDQTEVEVHFPHLEHLKLHTNPKKLLTNENAMKLLHSNKQLQSFEIWSCTALTLGELSNIISKNRSISKLDVLLISNMVNVTMAELMEFASEHPNMIELFLYGYKLSADDVIVFLGQSNSLKKFGCNVKDRLDYDRMINKLGNEWQHNASFSRRGDVKSVTFTSLKTFVD